MSVNSRDTITQSDMDALAALANAVGAPMSTNYEFSYFDDTVEPPTGVAGTIDPGAGSYEFAAGERMVVHIYSYNDVSGRKHYSKRYATGWVQSVAGDSAAAVDWTWTAPASAPDGYVYVLWRFADGSNLYGGGWELVGASPYTDDGTTLTDPNTGVHADQNPVEPVFAYPSGIGRPGPWLYELNRMRLEMFTDFTEDATWQVSGPWCVAVGPRLRFDATPDRIGAVAFWYAADDLAGNVDVHTVVEIGCEAQPLQLANDISPSLDVFQETLDFDLSAAKTVTGRIVFTCGAAVAGGHTESLTVTAGAVTVVTETWAVDGSTVTLDYEFDLPSGASTVRVDLDLNDAGNSVDPAPDFWGDVAVSTESVAPVDADVVHPTSAGKKAVPTAVSYAFTCTFKGTSYYPVFKVEDDTVEGVWTAETWPVFGVNPYVQASLPNYYDADDASSDRAEAGYQPGYFHQGSIEPAVTPRPALWPVFRDTDFGQWRRYAPHQGAYKPVPYWDGPDPFHHFEQRPGGTLAAGGATQVGSLAVPANYEKAVFQSSDPTCTVYVSTTTSEINPDNAATYDAAAVGEVRLPDDFAYAGGGTVWFLVNNETAVAATVYPRTFLAVEDADGNYPGDTPVFFPTDTDRTLLYERHSFNFAAGTRDGSSNGGTLQVQGSGYCVFRVCVARRPVAGADGVGVVPAVGTAELAVSLGLVLGCDYEDAGAYTEFLETAIAAGEGEVWEDVFWPVLAGFPLAYQCDERVDVKAFVNFQPAFTTRFLPARTATGQHAGRYSGVVIGTGSVSGIAGRATAYYHNSYGTSADLERVALPMSAELYNDTEAVLSLL